jgi:hypothetical protein
VKPTDASGPEPLVTVVPQRGVVVPVPGDGSAGSGPAAPGAEPPAECSCVVAPDPAAELAATAPTITVTAMVSEIVAVLDTCDLLDRCGAPVLPDLRSTTGGVFGFPLQLVPFWTDKQTGRIFRRSSR